MSPERRAVIFDLDDTLYPYRRFMISGFAAVAAGLAPQYGVNPRRILRYLVGESRGHGRGRELQRCFEAFDWPADDIPREIARLRDHQPTLRLSADAIATLAILRRRRWRLGVLTNGPREIQARKVAALGLEPYVDRLVYATETGTGAGKPELAPFQEIARQLDIQPSQAVFVGDDEICDIEGARRAGMHAVRCGVWRPVEGATAATTVIDRLSQVPQVAHVLIIEGSSRYVA